jgi:hypothetical protein
MLSTYIHVRVKRNIGQTLRMLKTRIKEHQYNSANPNINLHNLSCKIYRAETQKNFDEKSQNYTSASKAKFDYFQNRFKIIGMNFRHTKDREKIEAFLIRTQLSSLNDQYDHKAFKLF